MATIINMAIGAAHTPMGVQIYLHGCRLMALLFT